MRRSGVFIVTLGLCLALSACSSGPASDDAEAAPAGDSASEQLNDSDSTDEVAAPTWESSTITLPGAVDSPVNYCNSLDWSPVVTLFATQGITETDRMPGTWGEVLPAYWPTNGNTPAGLIYTGSCTLHLSSNRDPARLIGGVVAQVWLFEANDDIPAYWSSWDENGNFETELDATSITGAKLAALGLSYSGSPDVIAAGDHVMVDVHSIGTMLSNAEQLTQLDPQTDTLQAAFSAVAADALAHAVQ